MNYTHKGIYIHVRAYDELLMRERKERKNGKIRQKGREANSYTDQGAKWATGKLSERLCDYISN